MDKADSPPSIDVNELEIRLSNGIKLVDVRTQEEFDEMRITGAIHIPIDEFAERFTELNKQEDYCLICSKGGRSATATNFLLENGYKAMNVTGGTDAWVEAGKSHEVG